MNVIIKVILYAAAGVAIWVLGEKALAGLEKKDTAVKEASAQMDQMILDYAKEHPGVVN